MATWLENISCLLSLIQHSIQAKIVEKDLFFKGFDFIWRKLRRIYFDRICCVTPLIATQPANTRLTKRLSFFFLLSHWPNFSNQIRPSYWRSLLGLLLPYSLALSPSKWSRWFPPNSNVPRPLSHQPPLTLYPPPLTLCLPPLQDKPIFHLHFPPKWWSKLDPEPSRRRSQRQLHSTCHPYRQMHRLKTVKPTHPHGYSVFRMLLVFILQRKSLWSLLSLSRASDRKPRRLVSAKSYLQKGGSLLLQ